VEREPASSWYRQQVRQALKFGVRSAIVGVAALLWPLLLSLLTGNVIVTLVVYGIAMILDVVLAAMWFTRAFSYSRRAARGETFTLGTQAAPVRTRGIPAKH
jgi:hypothetical protein